MNSPSASAPSPAFEAATYKKLSRRLIPFLFLLYIVAFLDRVNVGYAKLQMSADLKFSEEVYGLGAGIFFIGYFFFEVPSNLILEKVGARLWIARILIIWGAISAGMMFVETPTQFYVMRFLLGVGEAGFFPGMILYLTYWFPSEYRVRMVALFMTAVAVAGVIGGPISGLIMQEMAGMNGWAGWQWLFLLEGVPAVLAGFATIVYLDRGPQEAKWLNPEEKNLVLHRLQEDLKQHSSVGGHHSFGASLKDYKVWALALIYFSVVIGFYGVVFFLPQLIKDMGVTDLVQNGLISAIPYGVGAVAMVLNGRHSDATMERRWHIAVPAILGGVGLAIAAMLADTSPVASIAALTLATAGALCCLSAFWSLPTAFLTGTAAAGGIALINSFGNLGGFCGPYIMGWVKDHLQSGTAGLYVLAGFLLLCAILVVGVFKRHMVAPTRKAAAA